MHIILYFDLSQSSHRFKDQERSLCTRMSYSEWAREIYDHVALGNGLQDTNVELKTRRSKMPHVDCSAFGAVRWASLES